jgi:hypothetical protein
MQVILYQDECGAMGWLFPEPADTAQTQAAATTTFLIPRLVASAACDNRAYGFLGGIGKKLLKIFIMPFDRSDYRQGGRLLCRKVGTEKPSL